MRFAHFADCHIGSWRDPKLRQASTRAFVKAVDLSIEKEVDFIVIAGDLFNTSLPSIDSLKEVVSKLKELKDNGTSVYIVPGSHDFSPSGKTMLDVLENAGLFVNVARGSVKEGKLKLDFTIDKKTNTKITGLPGKKGMLERSFYANLIKEDLEKEPGYKIFLFHTALTEFKPKELERMDSAPLSLLPRNFDYYAGGHPHYIFNKQIKDYGIVAYPGPLFPNNFRELEKFQNGGIYIVEDSKISYEPVQVHNVYSIKIDADNKTPEQVEADILEDIRGKEFVNTIVTIRVEGKLKSGKPSDINFKEVYNKLYEKSAYFVMKNTNRLTTKDFEEIKIDTSSIEEMEDKIVKEHLGQIKMADLTPEKEEKLIKDLIELFNKEKLEGERNIDFEDRIITELSRLLDIKIYD